MVAANTIPPTTVTSTDAGHAGSRSIHLTGRDILLAWLISLALHSVGLMVMFLLVFPYAAGKETALPVPRTELIGEIEASGSFSSQMPDSVNPQQSIEEQDVRFMPQPSESLSELSMSKKPELSIIGIGAGGGDFSQYGLTAGPGTGPVFFGLGGSARGVRRIVYVVDRSGSMLGTFSYVCKELKRSIRALRRSQKFHVIFFNSGRPLENPPKRLVSAIMAQKTAFFQFLDTIDPMGSTNPEPAMHRALSLEPDLVYFLTDGEFDAGLIDRLERWNEDRQVRIYTIAYFDESGATLLERIAREHGGEFKFVTEDDIP
ncbi:MAG: VWA domain-containing protein [Phycisphaerales bacterium]|nr:MAG: VWA domain-containing protein [Phycisphaerales bacterium]